MSQKAELQGELERMLERYQSALERMLARYPEAQDVVVDVWHEAVGIEWYAGDVKSMMNQARYGMGELRVGPGMEKLDELLRDYSGENLDGGSTDEPA